MAFAKLPLEAKRAAERIAKRDGKTPEEVATRSAKIFSERGAVYRKRNIL